MKFLVYKVKKKNNYAKFENDNIFEKVLLFLFIAAFTIMILAQALMIDPTIRASIIPGNQTDGLPLGEEEFLYTEGTIKLMLTSSSYQPQLKILVNGIETGAFSTNKANVTVKNGDVIEIDGSDLEDEHTVEILSQSENIISEHVGHKIIVKSDVARLLKVKME